MIKRFGNYKAEYQAGGSFEPLAPGAYVCSIIGAKVEETQYGQKLVFQVDVIEGEAAGYFQKRYQAGAGGQYENKYKGVFRINVPTGDGSEQDGWAINKFNSTMGAIEMSNPGFRFDFDKPEIGAFVPVDDVRMGKVRPMKKRELRNQPEETAPMASGFTAVETDELPF